MFSVSKEKVKPIISVIIDDENRVKQMLNSSKEPFIFLKKQDQFLLMLQ